MAFYVNHQYYISFYLTKCLPKPPALVERRNTLTSESLLNLSIFAWRSTKSMDPSNRENLSFLFKYYALVKSKQEHDFPKVLLTLLTIEEGKAILTRLCNLASTLRTDNYRVSHIKVSNRLLSSITRRSLKVQSYLQPEI